MLFKLLMQSKTSHKSNLMENETTIQYYYCF